MPLRRAARSLLVQEILPALAALPAGDWEQLAHRLAQRIFGVELRHRGQSARGNPQGYAIDSYSHDGTLAAEHSTEAGYFVDLRKPSADLQHARSLLPTATRILLLSNQSATAAQETAVINWQVELAATDGITVEVFDARRLAEFIADEIIQSDAAVDEVADYIEPLRRLRDLYAASDLVPRLWSGTVSRPNIETQIVERVTRNKVVVVSGISGMGKSDAAVATARTIEERFDTCFWVSGQRLTSVEELRALDVTRRGMRHNVLTMLSTRSVLLVLDDLRTGTPLSDIVRSLHGVCAEGSAVIVTSQIGVDEPLNFELPPLDRAEAERLLRFETPECSAEDLDTIWTAVGGHPLALRLLNGSVREGSSWQDAAEDARRVGGLAVLEKASTLADLIVSRWRPVIELALSAFLWAGSPRLHAGLLRQIAGRDGLRTLSRLGFIASDEADTIRLHEVVWNSLPALNPPLSIDEDNLSQRLHEYVDSLASDDARTMLLNHLSRLHHSLLVELISSEPLPGHLYAWLHYRGDPEQARALLPDPLSFAQQAAREPTLLNVKTAVEVAETRVYLTRQDQPEAIDAVEGLLAPFRLLLAHEALQPQQKIHVRHHFAKALKRLRRPVDATRELQAILADSEDGRGPPASRLLLARIFTETATHKRDGEDAARLLIELLDEALAEPSGSSASVTLAAAELLRRHATGIQVEAILPKYRDLLAPLIVAAAQRGLEQGVLTFAAIARAWQNIDSAGFWELFESIPIPSVADISDSNELEAYGELLEAAAAHNVEHKAEYLEEALAFHRKSNGIYGQTHAAGILVDLSRSPEAVELIYRILGRCSRDRDKAWPLFQLSRAFEASGNIEGAIEAAVSAEESLGTGNKHSDFFRDHRKRLVALGGR